MAKESEQTLIKDWVATTSWVKKVVFKFRSVRGIVTPAANTGRDRRRTAGIRTDQTNGGFDIVLWLVVLY